MLSLLLLLRLASFFLTPLSSLQGRQDGRRIFVHTDMDMDIRIDRKSLIALFGGSAKNECGVLTEGRSRSAPVVRIILRLQTTSQLLHPGFFVIHFQKADRDLLRALPTSKNRYPLTDYSNINRPTPAGQTDRRSQFLDATSHLYKSMCPSVRRSVRRSVGPSVRNAL